MQSIPQGLLDAYHQATDELASWDVLADWVHEQGPAPSTAKAPVGGRFWAIDRRELTQRGVLRWEGHVGPTLHALAPVLNASRALIDELRVTADWHAPRELLLGVFGADPSRREQHRLLPAVLDAVLAAAPITLRRLEIWLPATPLWGPQDDCLSQLAPLANARPARARDLTLRTPRQGLLALLERVVTHGWRSIRLHAPLTTDEGHALEALAAATPGTTFVRSGVDRSTPHVRAVADPDQWEIVVNGTPHPLEPGRLLLASPLEAALGEFDVRLNHQLGLLALERASEPRRGTVSVNGAPLTALYGLRAGTVRLEWAPLGGRAREGVVEVRRPVRKSA